MKLKIKKTYRLLIIATKISTNNIKNIIRNNIGCSIKLYTSFLYIKTKSKHNLKEIREIN